MAMTRAPKVKTPAQLGYRMPAEWEPHEATWIGWPHELSDWPGKFQPIPWAYGEIVRAIARHEKVRIIVENAAHEKRARNVLDRNGAGCSNVEFFRWPTNRGWTRDFGPFFIRRETPPRVALSAFRFNGWGKYPNANKDDMIPDRIARALKLPIHRARLGNRDIALEGGGVDFNGRGSMLTTEECFLDQETQPRNPGLTREEYERVFRDYLGVTNTLWLGRGIAGDDTHGHVDDLARFVNPTTVVLCHESNPRDVNYGPLQENRERLAGMKLEDGSKISVVPLPMPDPLYFESQRLPASYANFYICNGSVLVPTFNDPRDRHALGILADLFPDRTVVGIHAVDLVWGLGTLHCLTKEQTA